MCLFAIVYTRLNCAPKNELIEWNKVQNTKNWTIRTDRVWTWMMKQAKIKKIITKIHSKSIGKIPLRVYFQFLFIFGVFIFIIFFLSVIFIVVSTQQIFARALSLSLTCWYLSHILSESIVWKCKILSSVWAVLWCEISLIFASYRFHFNYIQFSLV